MISLRILGFTFNFPKQFPDFIRSTPVPGSYSLTENPVLNVALGDRSGVRDAL